MNTNTTLTDTKNGLSDGAAAARPILQRASEQVSALAHQGVEAWNTSSQQVRDRAHQATDTTASYIKDKPFTAVLIAAAGGAALMGLAALLSRTRYRD